MLHITDIQNVVQCKLKGGTRMYPATITKEGARLYVDWRGFSDELRLEIKAMDGHKYHGFDEVNPRKIWSVADNPRNRFQLAYLAHPGKADPDNPYHLYDKPLVEYQPKRSVYSHQLDFIRHFLTRHYCIVGGEMGTGKTLVAIEGIEQSGLRDWIWVGPKSALVSVKLEFRLWKCDITPRFFTYDGLKKWITEWVPGAPAPQGVVFDESSRLKNWTAQRTQAARHLANAIRTEWGVRGFVVEMSGTPAPKNPVDWWSQCEIAQPGFVREGTVQKFERRLAIVETRLAFEGGGSYPHRVSWRDDERKCDVCGLFREAETHDDGVDVHQASSTCHKFVPSVNEVAKLSKRLSGLVMVKFKKDCFSGDTAVLTRQGPRRLDELAKIGRAELYVMTDNGMEWVECPVRSFGTKRTYQLTFGDHNKVRTTMHHEWLWQRRGVVQQRKKFTFELLEGKTELPLAPIVLQEPDKEGYAHGFVYGDGTKQNHNHTKVELFGHDADLKVLLLEFGVLSYVKRKGWDSYNDVVASLPETWKKLPTGDCTPQYALGFVLGMVAADGCVDQHLRIYQADEWALERVRLLAIYAGLRVSPLRMSRELSPFDGSYKPLYYFSIQTYNVRPEWILRRDHRAKLKVRGRSSSTTVTDIDYQSGRDEETYCAVVPRWHNFTLANGVVTGNCVDLPPKIYKEVQCKPTRSMLNAASAISASATSTIKALTLLRELSDGFQYEDTATRMETCRLCEGRRVATQWYDRSDPDTMPEPEEFEDGHRRVYTGEDEYGAETWTRGKPIDPAQRQVACYSCSGTGEVMAYTREAKYIPTPKEDALRDIMDEHDDVGRLVTYAGFQASIDRICTISQGAKWHYIRVDGRGWHTNLPVTKPEDMVTIFQKEREKFPRVMFNGQPGSAGMGLTLTAAPTIVYYSNDFNGESRIQSEDRIHRIGMSKTRGATIVDLLCLPSDTLVLNNLKKKKRLQDMSMGELKSLLAAAERELERSL